MPNKMLIDASHPEETRVVVVRGNRIEEFDFESQSKKQLKGNIYLARVTRVEPSLQAAFVEYGGNRHGFLAFSEIHPDYYQIPVADRQALLAAEAAAAAEEDEQDSESRQNGRRSRNKRRGRGRATTSTDENGTDIDATAPDGDAKRSETRAAAAEAHADSISEAVELPDGGNGDSGHGEDGGSASDDSEGDNSDGDNSDGDHDDSVEIVGQSDPLDELPDHRRLLRRNYKIQEVIKRRQIMLVQVVKEERGNKGAALTTYLSLAGRYSVLMPNTARGGGISRKITSAQDRKRLKDIVKELDVPQGMGVILRTAGANRTKVEIKRDYEYLMRLWMRIRNLTLESSAPALVHEEGSLIKRSVRDLYNKDIDQILVAGDEGYREAKDFMRMLMPSHAKVVQPYRDKVPIFARNGIEAQLDRMLQPQVTLKSGGYIIINQTEALVAIDVNSGRSTREHSIESTALLTNLEAAEEVARQLRLRDLAGLIVIDFIDMEEKRNNRAVEKRLKDCLKNDRARIQVGRISHFGLLEMSRQRIRSSVLESTMRPCEVCNGTGFVRTDSSVALHVLRGIEEYLLKDSSHDVIVHTRASTALYMLNHKRHNLSDLESRFGLSILIEADDSLGLQHYSIEKGELSTRQAVDLPEPLPLEEEPEEVIEDIAEPEEAAHGSASESGNGKKKRRRRRRRGSRDGDSSSEVSAASDEATPSGSAEDSDDASAEIDSEAPAEPVRAEAGEDGESHSPRKRRRGRRGGQRSRAADGGLHDRESHGEPQSEADDEASVVIMQPESASEEHPASTLEDQPAAEDSEPAGPVDAEAAERSTLDATAAEAAEVPDEDAGASVSGEEVPAKAKPARKSRARKTPAKAAAIPAPDAESVVEELQPETSANDQESPAGSDATEGQASPSPVTKSEDAPAEPVVVSIQGEEEKAVTDAPRKEGWWRRRGFF